MRKFVLSLIAVLVAVASYAQVTTSGISGQVTDENGLPLIGATVYAVHTPSGTDYGVASNLDGRFAIQGMRTGGPYTVTISYVGYQTIETTDIVLTLGEVLAFNAALPEGHNIDEIVVSASSSSMFNASKTGAASNFTAADIANVPSVSRSVYDVVTLSPLANSTGSGVSFAGSNNRYNSFQIDGAVTNDVFGLSSSGTNGGQTGSNAVSLDAIEEIQVVVAPYDVRQSGFTGGGINAITKSGTNTVTGSVYAYYTDENLYGTTAGDMEDGESREKMSELTTSVLGLTIGGPIVKDKLFAFVSVERSLSEEPVSYGVGMSSDYLSASTAQAILDRYNEATGYSDTYGTHNTTKQQSLDIMARIDWNINQNNKFMFRYQFKEASDDKYGSYYNSFYFDNSSYSLNNNTQSFVAELNSRISNNVSNELRVSYNRVRDYREVDYLGPNVIIYNADFTDNRTGTIYLGTEINSGANALNQDVFSFTDNVTYYKGNHTLTFGTHNEIYSLGNTYIQYSTGSYAYYSLDDYFNDNASKYYYAYATEEDNTDYMPVMNAGQFALYAQDEWKPNNDFTLTYGLRVDMPVVFNTSPVNEAFNSDDALTSNGKYLTGQMPDASLLWSPRVGFRYFLDEEHRSLLRGGTGIFTGRVPFVWMHNAFSNSGVDKASITVSSDVPTLSATPSEDGVAGAATVNTISKDFKYPQVFRTNLAYEHIFDNGWKVTLEGLYSKTLNNVVFNNLALADNGEKVYSVTAEAATEANTSTYYTQNSDYSAIVNLENTSKGYSYNLSAMVEKSFAMGINLMASYTFGHSYSVNDGTSSVAYSNWKYNYSINTNDINELSYASFDVPHRLSASVNYNSPVYGNGRWNTVAGLTYNGSTGYRYSYVLADYSNFNGDGYYSNTLLYIPTDAELDLMNWDSNESKEAFKEWIEGDKYASSHRGQYSERYAGVAPFEHHFNLHLAQNYIYNKAKNSRIELSFDIMNIGNLINRSWGMYTESVYNLAPIQVSSVEKVSGGYEATYKWNSSYYDLREDSDDSRWYMQLGVRVTF